MNWAGKDGNNLWMLRVAIELDMVAVSSMKSADEVFRNIGGEFRFESSSIRVEEIEVDLVAIFPDHR